MAWTREETMAALGGVMEPELGKDLVTLGLVAGRGKPPTSMAKG